MTYHHKILLVEDDPNFGKILKSYLELADYQVTLKEDGKMGLSSFKNVLFDLCILDIMLPEMDGFTLAREIKKIQPEMPLIFLTAKSLKEDVLEGFKLGADDYLTKPFDSEVLLYKIAAVLKRSNENSGRTETPHQFNIGSFTFYPAIRELTSKTGTYQLSPKESELLKLLCLAAPGILNRRDALLKIWEADNYFTTRSMDVFLAKLRKYLKADPEVEIVNVHGNGFRLVDHSGKNQG